MPSHRNRRQLVRTVKKCEDLIDSEQLHRGLRKTIADANSLFFHRKYLMVAIFNGIEYECKTNEHKQVYMFFPTGAAMKCHSPTLQHHCTDVVSVMDTDPLWVDMLIWKEVLALHKYQCEHFQKAVWQLEEGGKMHAWTSVMDVVFFSLQGIVDRSLKSEGICVGDDLLEKYPDLRKRCRVRLIAPVIMNEYVIVKFDDVSGTDWRYEDSEGRHYVTWIHPAMRQWMLLRDMIDSYCSDELKQWRLRQDKIAALCGDGQ